MSRISRLVVLVTALASLFAVLSSTAGAVTFTNTGSTNFHATAGPGTLTITSSPARDLVCQDATATGTAAMTFTTITGTATFTNCLLVGIHTEVGCSYTFSPSTFTGISTDGVTSVNCVARLATTPNTALCNITGALSSVYVNPSGGTPGRLTLQNQSGLTVSNNSDASCSAANVPTGTTRSGDLSETTFTLTDATGPIIATP